MESLSDYPNLYAHFAVNCVMKTINLDNIPDELYRQIAELAAKESRSLNQQFLMLIEQGVKLDQPPQLKLIEKIDKRREKIALRVGILPDSTDLVREDRER